MEKKRRQNILYERRIMNRLSVRSSWHAHCLSRVPLLYAWLSVCTQPGRVMPRERLNLDTVSLLISFSSDSFQVLQCNPSRPDYRCNVTFSFQGITLVDLKTHGTSRRCVCHISRCGVSIPFRTLTETRSRCGQCELSFV